MVERVRVQPMEWFVDFFMATVKQASTAPHLEPQTKPRRINNLSRRLFPLHISSFSTFQFSDLRDLTLRPEVEIRPSLSSDGGEDLEPPFRGPLQARLDTSAFLALEPKSLHNIGIRAPTKPTLKRIVRLAPRLLYSTFSGPTRLLRDNLRGSQSGGSCAGIQEQREAPGHLAAWRAL